MTQLRQSKDTLEALGVRVAVVTFDSSSMARAYVEDTHLEWPLLIDADRRLYRAYGMDRIDWWSVYGPASIWHYLKLVFGRGRRIPKPGSDFQQVGGDVLIDPEGHVRFHFVSTSPHDRPSVELLLNKVREASARTT